MPELTPLEPPPDLQPPSEVPAAGQPARRRPARRRPAGRGPLPDAVAIDVVAVPDGAPPFDDTPAATPPRSSARRRHASGSDPEPAGPGQRTPDAAGRTDPPGVQGPDPWPSQFAQVLAETLAGSRPARQITPWTTEQTRKRISQLGPMLATVQRPRLRRVIVTSPATDVLEMTIIVGLGPRVHALAVRLERDPAPPSGPSPTGRSAAPPARPNWRIRGTPAAPPELGRWYCTEVEAA